MEMFTSKSGTRLRHVPYKGTAQALNDLIGGTIPVMFSGLTGVPGLLAAGKVRALGISSRSRLKILPNVPTIAEAGLPGFEAMGFVILAAPAGTPSSIVEQLHVELNKLDESPDIHQKYDTIGYVTDRSPPPQDVERFIENQIAVWTEVVAKAGLSHSQ
jgi:tripartite-type tricarboxylate transporter receptor subunit TctC